MLQAPWLLTYNPELGEIIKSTFCIHYHDYTFLHYRLINRERGKEGGGQDRRRSKNRVEWSHGTQPNMLTSGAYISGPHVWLTNSFSITSPAEHGPLPASEAAPWSSGQLPDSQLLKGSLRFTEQDGHGTLRRRSQSPFTQHGHGQHCAWDHVAAQQASHPPHRPLFYHKEVSKRLWQGWCTQRLQVFQGHKRQVVLFLTPKTEQNSKNEKEFGVSMNFMARNSWRED